jgi:hypothetical protein
VEDIRGFFEGDGYIPGVYASDGRSEWEGECSGIERLEGEGIPDK